MPTENNLQMRWHQLRRNGQVLPGMNQYVSTTWIPNRRSVMLEAFTNRASGRGPAFYIDGRRFAAANTSWRRLTMTIPFGSGTIWYTTDGVDLGGPGPRPDHRHRPQKRRQALFVPPPTSVRLDRRSGAYNDAAWTTARRLSARLPASATKELWLSGQDHDIGSRCMATPLGTDPNPFEVKARDLPNGTSLFCVW